MVVDTILILTSSKNRTQFTMGIMAIDKEPLYTKKEVGYNKRDVERLEMINFEQIF